MSFIVLLLISLSALTAVQTRSADVESHLTVARSNALLALAVAVGQLQEHTGSDTRVTGGAQILDAEPMSAAIDNVLHPHWTGVWRRNENSGEPQLLTWLVSGNEGKQEGGGGFFDARTSSLDDSDAVTLVGAGTLGAGVDGSVRVPLLKGADGGYAYWVSDEQSKAQINRVDSSIALATDTGGLPRTFARQHQFPFLGFPERWLVQNDVNRALNSGQIAAAMNVSTDVIAPYFHDLTAASIGLLTDARNGGLKIDLTALLNTELPNEYKGKPLYDAPEEIREDPLATQSPTWDYVKSFHDLYKEVEENGKITPRVGSESVHGISPVIAMFGYGISGGLFVDPANPAHPDNNRTFVNIFPKLVLYNPYNVTLSGKKYGLVLFANQVAEDENLPSGKSYWNFVPAIKGAYNTNYPSDTSKVWRVYEIARAFMSGSDNNTRTDKEVPGASPATLPPGAPRFIVDCPDIPPGQAVVLMADATANYDRYGDRENLLSNNSDEKPLRWFTRLFLKPSATPADPTVILDSVQWSLYTNANVSTVYLDAALVEPEALTDSAMWRQNTSVGQKYLHRRNDAAFWGKVYQLTGRVPVRVDDYSAPATATNFYGMADTNAPELVSWGAYGFLAHDDAGRARIRPYINFNIRATDLDAANIADADGELSHSFYKGYGGNPSGMPIVDYFDSGRKMYLGGGYTEDRGGVESLILYDVPVGPQGLYSLGQLQHMKVSDRFDEPAYAIGNSWASPLVGRSAVYRRGAGDAGGTGSYIGNMDYSNVDVSYLLNEALWDRYFFSTVTGIGATGSHTPLNPVLQIFHHADTTYDFSNAKSNAKYLYQSGAFNVNSTSKVAWKALLSALNGTVLPELGNDSYRSAFFRFARQRYGQGNTWAGFRELSEDEIDELASAIVTQIKMRGPALSLADFINRALVDEAEDADGLGVQGALQVAIDATSINQTNVGHEVTADNTTNFPHPRHSQGRTADGISSYLTQADLLSALSPMLTVRSDSFLIRCYGSALNPSTGEAEAQAWCEAIVQRVPEYVDAQANSAEDDPSLLSEVNRAFGRRYEIVSFRWLQEGEI